VAQTGLIKQNQINCLKIEFDLAIDFGEVGAERIATAVGAACLLADVGWHGCDQGLDRTELVYLRQVVLGQVNPRDFNYRLIVLFK